MLISQTDTQEPFKAVGSQSIAVHRLQLARRSVLWGYARMHNKRNHLTKNWLCVHNLCLGEYIYISVLGAELL